MTTSWIVFSLYLKVYHESNNRDAVIFYSAFTSFLKFEISVVRGFLTTESREIGLLSESKSRKI